MKKIKLPYKLKLSTCVRCTALGLAGAMIFSSFYGRASSDTMSISKESLGSAILFGDLSSFSMWRYGTNTINDTQYTSEDGKISLKDNYACQANATYAFSISNPEYQILVREIDRKGECIASGNLKSGQVFSTSDKTISLAVTLYNPKTSSISYQAFKSEFLNGLKIQLYISDPTGKSPALVVPMIEDIMGINATAETGLGYSTEGTRYIVSDEYGETDYDYDNETFMSTEDGTEDYSDASNTETIDFESQWRSGCYSNSTGEYISAPNRICYNDYLTVEGGTEYYAYVSNEHYSLLIRELNANKELVASYPATNGKSFTLKNDTVYVGVTLYCPTNDKISYERYKELFESGLTVSFSTYTIKEDTSATESDNSSYFDSAWRPGGYNYLTGVYDENMDGKICYADYMMVNGGDQFMANISNPNYHLLVRELDEDYIVLQSNDLSNEKVLTLSPNTRYLAVILYNSVNTKMTYEEYRQLFATGFTTYLSYVKFE